MSGFLGILDTPVLTPHLQERLGEAHPEPSIAASPADAKVESVVLKMEALMDLIEFVKMKNVGVKRQ